jgi:ribosomal protein S18 acetylase RimI-like enzyme
MKRNEIEQKIMNLVRGSDDGIQVEEMGSRLGLTRHTVSKYLEVLRARELVTYRVVGRAKLWKEIGASVTIRPLTLADIPDLLDVEGRIEQELVVKSDERMEYLKETAKYNIEHSDPMLSLGAEVDGKLVGFMIGEMRLWEFGKGEKTGWVRILGVDSDFRRRGVGKKLGDTLLEHFKRRGIKRVRTMVEWYTGDLILYFKSFGFNMLNMIPLEKEL